MCRCLNRENCLVFGIEFYLNNFLKYDALTLRMFNMLATMSITGASQHAIIYQT